MIPKTRSLRKPTLCYLLSASHSGSTLLAMLLGAQEGICSAGELKAAALGNPDLYRCSCGRFIKECEFWSQVQEEMAQEGIADFDITRAGTNVHQVESRYCRRLLAPLFRGLPLELARDAALHLSPRWRNHLRETRRRNAALIKAVGRVAEASVVVDSSKQALRLKYLLHDPGFHVKVIRLVRDGRAVSLTYLDEWTFADASDVSLRGGGSGFKRPSLDSMAVAANQWKRSNEAADCLVKGLPDSSWTHVSYEELCQDPGTTLQRLQKFLGFDDAEVNLNFRSVPQHVIGNGMRLDSTSQIRLDDRWRSHLSASDLEGFDRVAGGLNRSYGYT